MKGTKIRFLRYQLAEAQSTQKALENQLIERDAKGANQASDDSAIVGFLVCLANRYYDSPETKGKKGLQLTGSGSPPPFFHYLERRLRWADYMQDRKAELLNDSDELPQEYNMIFGADVQAVKTEVDGSGSLMEGVADDSTKG